MAQKSATRATSHSPSAHITLHQNGILIEVFPGFYSANQKELLKLSILIALNLGCNPHSHLYNFAVLPLSVNNIHFDIAHSLSHSLFHSFGIRLVYQMQVFYALFAAADATTASVIFFQKMWERNFRMEIEENFFVWLHFLYNFMFYRHILWWLLRVMFWPHSVCAWVWVVNVCMHICR